MRSKRYFGEDLRSAVLKVRHELGPNAVILAQHRNHSGVEVTAVPSDDTASQKIWKPEINDETLDVKNVRDSYEDSIRENVQYYNSMGGDVIKAENSSDSAVIDNADAVENDFEAEIDMILNTQHVSVKENQQQQKASDLKTNKKKDSILSRNRTVTKRKRSESKVHTVLSKLKIKPEEKQTVIRSGSTGTSDKATPPVLSNSLVHDEIVNSIEQQIGEYAYGESARSNPVRAELIRQLMKLDISPFIIQRVVNTLLSDKVNQKMLLPQALALIANQIPIYKEDITSVGGIVALFGGTGVGKTTSIAKLAARFAMKHGTDKVALITTDDNRIAATEQLRTYSNILGVPLRIAKNDIDVLNALNTFSDKEFVLIDTAGMSPRELKKSKYYELFSGGITQIKKFQVLPATMNRSALEKMTAAFCKLGLHGSIISKVDETTSLGGVISVAIQNNLPVGFYGNGQTIPDDFYLARAHILMSHVVGAATQFDEQETDEVNGHLTSGIVNNVNF